MIQLGEMRLNLPMEVANGVISTTSKVWDILVAAKNGDIKAIKKMLKECPELIYAQYNYTAPIHFAVREGHIELVKYLLAQGAHDPAYKMYPFGDTLDTIAGDRGLDDIVELLRQYAANPSLHKYKGDNGKIFFNRTDLQLEFENAVDKEDLDKVTQVLNAHPEFACDETYFWGEGILMMPAKKNKRTLIELLMSYGARVPDILKWTQFYYFERYDAATFLMEKGMNPNVMSWHHVSILHDMAQKGDIHKAELLVKYGSDINEVEEEYQSTPLGLAARWGRTEMVKYLLAQGADPDKSGASWATPLSWAKKKGHVEIEKILKHAGAGHS